MTEDERKEFGLEATDADRLFAGSRRLLDVHYELLRGFPSSGLQELPAAQAASENHTNSKSVFDLPVPLFR